MITNENYLIEKYAEAACRVSNDRGDREYRNYWQGTMDTYHSLLSDCFRGWTAYGTVGHYVFTEGMTYDNAIVASEKHTTQQYA